MRVGLFLGVMACVVLGGVSLLSAEEAEMKDMYPHLNSNADGSPPACTLKRAEALWLTEQMEAGTIRTATEEDIKAWEDLAKKKNRPNQTIYVSRDCGRIYAILKPMVIDGLSEMDRVFIVPKGVPFPEVGSGVAVYDINRGGAFQAGSYDDGEQQGYGLYPDAPNNPFKKQPSNSTSQ